MHPTAITASLRTWAAAAAAATAAKLGFAALLCLWTSISVAWAQARAPGTLAGQVVEVGLDDYGVLLAEVRVAGTDLATTTDDAGNFRIDGVPDGPLELRVTAEDYAPLRVTISEVERRAPVLLGLSWAGAGAVAATTATQMPEQPTASTTRISAREMAASDRKNAEEILRQVPGLTLVQHGSEGKGHQFFMRGFDAIHGADLELTLDGMPLNEWSNIHAQGYIDLGIIIPEMLKSVVVTKGPFTLAQGPFAMAGSAHYHLGVPSENLGWRAAYTIGTTNRHRIFAGYRSEERRVGKDR